MHANLQNWLAKVVAERAKIVKRIGPVGNPKPNPEVEALSIYRAAAALLEWEQASALSIEAEAPKMSREEMLEEASRRG